MEPDVVCEREGRQRDDQTPHPLRIQCPHAGTFEIYRNQCYPGLEANTVCQKKEKSVGFQFDLQGKKLFKTQQISV